MCPCASQQWWLMPEGTRSIVAGNGMARMAENLYAKSAFKLVDSPSQSFFSGQSFR
jgi:hypothetical protein